MQKIQQLPEQLANQIAAGEVVERPASVVKELIENSIDANSTAIKVAIEEAGLKTITVIDNGDGIGEEDIQRAFLRHATSKIKYEEDLFHIKSLGFRGEALASIASVSKLMIKSSTGESSGLRLYLEAGEVVKKEKSDARRGTEVTISDIFYNTPARLKYVKSLYTELGHITDLINRYAMAHPNIRFELVHNDKQLFYTPGHGKLLQVIQQVYGTSITKKMIPIHADSLDFTIDGYIAKPTETRSNRNYMTFIVNGRYVKSNALTHAILRGYNKLLMVHRYPISVVSITLDPVLTDVNVHPTKLEIRFSKEKELITLLEEAVSQHLKQINLIPKIERKEKQKLATEQAAFGFETNSKTVQDNPDNNKKFNAQIIEKESPPINIEAAHFTENDIRQNEDTNSFHNQDIAHENNQVIHASRESQKQSIPTMYPIGQLHGTYILAQNHEGLYLIDQHAAQERIKYEFFKEKIGDVENQLQSLLVPLSFDFTKEEMLYIDQYKDELEKIGIFLEPFGGQTYAVRAYPNWFPQGEEADIIRDLIEQIIKDQKTNIKKLREEAAILMSCKRSIKANHYLTHDDMARLLTSLAQTEAPYSCPHGRPVIIQFSNYEIERMFKRVQD